MIEVPSGINQAGDRTVGSVAKSHGKFIYARPNSAVHEHSRDVISDRHNVCAVAGEKEDSLAEWNSLEWSRLELPLCLSGDTLVCLRLRATNPSHPHR
jgi:hypothetical protein